MQESDSRSDRTTTHGSPELDEDARKLEAMGADPGPAWDVRVIVCEECGGDGGWDYQVNPHHIAHQKCRGCDGKGHIEVLFLECGDMSNTEITVVEHLNRVVALSDLTLPPLLTGIADAALYLLRSHRENGTQIRQSVYDYAVAVEALNK